MDSIFTHIDNWLTEQHNYRVIKRALHGMTLNHMGKLTARSYTAEDGSSRSITEIEAEQVEKLRDGKTTQDT